MKQVRKTRDPGRHRTWKWTALALVVGGGVLYLYVAPRHVAPQPERAPTPVPGPLGPVVTPRRLLPPPQGGPMAGLSRGGGRTFASVDLNSATLAELQTLPGMTSEYARKIIAGRPFRGRDDLERAGIPRDVFERMSPPAMIRWVETGLPPPGPTPAAGR
jgi:hypothetical protein